MTDPLFAIQMWAAGFAAAYGDVWHPGFADPTLTGKATTIMYFVAAALCFRAFARSPKPGEDPRYWPSFWLAMGILLVLLGSNKQLDVQTWFTVEGRSMAKAQGWYYQRRGVQWLIIASVVLVAACSFAVAMRFMKDRPAACKAAAAGCAFLLCFLAVRAVSIHYVDLFIMARFEGLKINGLIENGGILAVAAPSLWASPRPLRS